MKSHLLIALAGLIMIVIAATVILQMKQQIAPD
jgi:hypothetical protein